jgi:hypothetical protein
LAEKNPWDHAKSIYISLLKSAASYCEYFFDSVKPQALDDEKEAGYAQSEENYQFL